MGEITPQALLIIMLLAISIWLGSEAVKGAKIVGRKVAEAGRVVGCGAKHILTGHECEKKDPQ